MRFISCSKLAYKPSCFFNKLPANKNQLTANPTPAAAQSAPKIRVLCINQAQALYLSLAKTHQVSDFAQMANYNSFFFWSHFSGC